MSLASILSNVLVIAGTGGVGLAVVNQIFARRKSNAEAESIEADTAAKLLKGVTSELERLQKRQIGFEERVAECERAREDAEGRAREAERHAHNRYLAEQELRSHLATLQRAYTMTRRRVEYLTEVVQQAGVTVAAWDTPPSGLDPKETV